MRGRLIPVASNSITVTFSKANQTIASQTIPRPANGNQTSVAFNGLKVGALTLSATAFPNSDGTGVAQASGNTVVNIQAGQTTNVTLTMASTVDHLDILPASGTLYAGQTQQETFTAKDASGAVVLVSPSVIQWSTDNGAAATVSGSGLVTAVGTGMANITVKDNESGKTATAVITSKQISYTIQEVTVIVGTGNSQSEALNNQGFVTGQVNDSTTPPEAFIWSQATGSTRLGILGASPLLGNASDGTGINSSNQVVGNTTTVDGLRAFLWSAGTGMVSLGALGPASNGNTNSQAYGINDNGQVVGYSTTSDGERAILWDSVHGMQSLGVLGTKLLSNVPVRQSFSNAINESGTVVGDSSDTGGQFAYIWDSANGMRSLGALGHDMNGWYSRASGINSLSHVVGQTGTDQGDSGQAFYWTQAGGMKLLGLLEPPPGYSDARGINDLDQVVGNATISNGKNQTAFLWMPAVGMIDLNTRIPANSGWSLSAASGINNKGQIVGYGQLNGHARAFLLTPVP